MKQNRVIDFKVVTDLTTEPVTLPDIKKHLNMLFETEGSFEFTDDDAYLSDLGKQARVRLEKYTGCSFGPKSLRAIVDNSRGDMEIPYGPINTVTAVLNDSGDTITTDNYTVRGIEFKTLRSPCDCYVDIAYTAGYTTLPLDLKRAILEEVAYRYENRGAQEESNICQSALQLAEPYSRNVWLL